MKTLVARALAALAIAGFAGCEPEGAGGGDVLARRDVPESAEEKTRVEPSPLEATPARLGAAGDFGGRDEFAGALLNDILGRDLDAFFLLGDISYGERGSEQGWCDWVHGYVGASYPLEVLSGNHEDDRRHDGHIWSYASCMPDRLGSEVGPGGYGVNYASDLGPVTLIATSPDIVIGGVHYRYAPGTPELDWLLGVIVEAQRQGDWVVVAMHKNCLTIGTKDCQIGPELAQLLIERGVDLVLQGHDHDYQRTHSLASVVEGGVGHIADAGADDHYARGAGTVFVIVGTAGQSPAECGHEHPEYGNFAAHWCREEALDTKGYLLVEADGRRLRAEFVTTVGTRFEEAFTIR